MFLSLLKVKRTPFVLKSTFYLWQSFRLGEKLEKKKKNLACQRKIFRHVLKSNTHMLYQGLCEYMLTKNLQIYV